MISRIEIQKKLLQLGTISVALMIGTVSLGCTKAVEPEETKETASTVVAETTDVATSTVEATATPSPTPSNTPSPTPTPEPTAEPSPTPYDPYTLSDEEAIEIGTYIYDNYIAKYIDNHATFFYKWSEEYQEYQLEDIINYVCILNRKYPLYEDRRSSSLVNGNCMWLRSMHEAILDGDDYLSVSKRINNLFPYSIFLKEGRPERALLEELEEGFRYISDNEVSNEEIYSYWGKVFKLAIHSDETFKDWDPFQYYMFYYTIRGQYYFVLAWPEIFNNIPYDVPAKYVFDNNKNVKLKLEDAFYMRNTVRRNKYPGLTDQEFNEYVGCLEEYLDKCAIITNDKEYVKQKIKGSN